MKNQKEQKLITATNPLKGCGHLGKWNGNGQSIFKLENSIMIISTSVCGECGQPVISVNKIGITPVKLKDEVITTGPIQLPSRFSKKN